MRKLTRSSAQMSVFLKAKVKKMAKCSPFYSSEQLDVYHDNTSCTEGNNIEARFRASGTGGLPQCSHCRRLS